MDRRKELHEKLIEISGIKNVYFQPPENLVMQYPCIRYSLLDINDVKANNKTYVLTRQYQIMVIDRRPDNEAIDKLLNQLPMSSYDRRYTSDNLYHDVLSIYY